MRINICVRDGPIPDAEWEEVWAPHLTEAQQRAYLTLREMGESLSEVDLDYAAARVGVSKNRLRMLMNELDAVGLIRFDEGG